MNKKKLLNDPIYGFVTIPHELLLQLVDHPYFQRLRRIKQVGLTDYVFPGASHSRFHHALGALHLMNLAINTLRSKGTEITDDEAIAVSAAILLHDIGHAPYSHVLEDSIIPVPHEEISLAFMYFLNKEFDGHLDLTIKIFTDSYKKKFLHQLVSSQLDMDRLDYLNRDSFYTGVAEGVVGYDRIIKLLNVHNNQLVIEEKGFFSVEKYLISRHFMYWQVYLHKAVIAAEQMLIQTLRRIEYLLKSQAKIFVPDSLKYFLERKNDSPITDVNNEEILMNFANLDDSDILFVLKSNQDAEDKILSQLCSMLLNRKLYKIRLSETPFPDEKIRELSEAVQKKFDCTSEEASYLVVSSLEKNTIYDQKLSEILVLKENEDTIPMSSFAKNLRLENKMKYFICFPAEVQQIFANN